MTSSPTANRLDSLVSSYQTRRRRLLDQVGSGLVLIDSSGVAPDPALWDRNLAYLTGLTTRNAWLLMAADGVRIEGVQTLGGPELGRGRLTHEILFVEAPSAQDAFMGGAAPTLDAIRAATGVEVVYPLSEMSRVIERGLMEVKTVWLNQPSRPSLDAPQTVSELLMQRVRERFFWLDYRNVAPLIHQMRFVKDAFEIDCLREAFTIQGQIFEKMMRSLKPGTNEALGQAIWEYEIGTQPLYVGHSNDNSSYESSIIVGSGPNSATPHHMKNTRTILDGDLVLIDTGASVHGYCSDITRTFPANGRFTPRQRELYAVVLEAEDAAIATIRPGSTMLAAHQAVYDVFNRYGLAKYSYGNCGHPVGLNIHDANGRTPDDREQPFEPGVVVVVEPFLMMIEEGFGIRVEDGVLVTETGCEVLSGPPREIDAVEALCRR